MNKLAEPDVVFKVEVTTTHGQPQTHTYAVDQDLVESIFEDVVRTIHSEVDPENWTGR